MWVPFDFSVLLYVLFNFLLDLNILFVCLPLAWVWHFKSHEEHESSVFTDRATFACKSIYVRIYCTHELK